MNYLKENKHIVIQGPPGTGKSESITGIIINALEHGKKCLVVCEKKTAMEVLKTNLSNISSEIGDLVAVIEDVSRDRKQIVESVRDRYEMYGGNRFERPADTNLTETWELIEEHIEDINYRKKYFYEDEIVNDKKTKGWSSGVGKELLSKTRNKKNYIRSKIEKKISLEGPIDYNETSTNLRKIESEIKLLDYQNLLKKIPQSEILNNDPFKLQEQLSKLVPKSSKELKDFISVFENHLFDLEAKISDKIDSFINDIEASIKTLESKISNYSEKPSFKQDNIWYQVIKRIPFSSKGLKNDIEIFEYSNNTISQIVEKTSFVGVEISISANRTIESNLEDLKIVKSWINDFKLLSRDFKQKKYDLLIEEEFLGVKIKNEFKVQFLKWKKDLSECLDKYQTNKNNWHTTSNFLKALKWMLEFIVEISSAIDQGFINHFQWQSNFYKQPNFLQQFITLLLEEDAREWKGYFDEYYYHNQLVKNFNHKLSGGYDAQLEFLKTERERISNEIKSKIPKYWKFIQSEIPNVNIPQLYNKRGSRGNRRNSLRKIAKRSFDSLTAYFPVMMVSPNVCASMFELKPDLFDYVIFDEASQLKVEESITTLIRGERKVISGDSNQMPPSYWFTAIADSEEYEEEDLDPYQTWNENLLSNEGATDLANSESLLEFAELCGFKSFHLDFHYRSHHPLLIEFSNAAFYKGRLHPLPERIIHSPIQFITVNGLYENQQNRDEANVAIEILKNIQPGKNGELPSVGIATFNQKQKNLILELLKREFQLDQEFRERYLELEEKGLFVKNLENIQGDERDIIILCTTFGRDKEGIAQRKYGPIATTGLGHRLLNVIITRAKKKVFVLTSVPPEFYSGYKSELVGTNKVERGYFHAYLAYAKAVSEKDLKSVEAILTFLRGESKTNYTELGLTESPFEEAVYQYLIKEIDEERITLQYKTGGFRIDIAIKSKITGKEFLAIECDGATYHSSVEAYAWDSYRQEILEEHGFTFHRIWSRDFWENSDREIKKLVSFIKAQDELDQGTEALKDPVASHLFVKDLLEQTHFIEVEDEIKTEELSDDQDEEELNVSEENQVITDVEIRQKVVQVGDKITLLELDTGKELKVKFIKRNNNVNQSNGLIILSEKSPLGEVVIGRKVGETVELNNVEKYYRIIFIED
ncbi:MAG: AAA domain-containing protein [Balneola sp.]